MSEQAPNTIQTDPMQIEAMRRQELSTVAEASDYISVVVQGARSVSESVDGRQDTPLAGVSFTREWYYPPSHDYQHDEVRIDYPDGSAAVASELDGVTFISFYDKDRTEKEGPRSAQSADHPGLFRAKDTSHAQEKASPDFIAFAQEFKAKLESRADNPNEYSLKTRLKHKISGMAGRNTLVGAEVALKAGVIIGASEAVTSVIEAGDHVSVPVAVAAAASSTYLSRRKKK